MDCFIELSKGYKTRVDEGDLPWLSQWKWSVQAPRPDKLYAVRVIKIRIGDSLHSKAIYMHRIILDAEKGQDVDHINGNGLDNRRANLRLCSRKQNQANKRKGRGKSKYKGVSWNSAYGKWKATTGTKFLGYFTEEDQAAKEYDKAALQEFGEFAALNFSDSGGAQTWFDLGISKTPNDE